MPQQQQQATTPRRFPESHKKKKNKNHCRITDAFFLCLGAVVYLTVQLVGPLRWSTARGGVGGVGGLDGSNTATLQQAALLLWQDSFFSTTVRRRAAVDTTDNYKESTSTMKHPSLAIYNNDDDYPTDAKPMVIGPDYKPPSYYLRKQQQQRIKHQQQRITMNMNMIMTPIMRLGHDKPTMKNMAVRVIPQRVAHRQEDDEEDDDEEKGDEEGLDDENDAPNDSSEHSHNNMLVLSVSDQQQEESPKKRPVKATSRNMIKVVGPQKKAPSLTMRRGGQVIRHARNRKQQQETRKLRVEDGRHPIFYNFYVPPENYRKAILIAQEQMRQRDLLTPGAPLYYTLIGYPNITTKFCEPNCWQYQYLETGQEVDTLQSLWEYCHQVGQDDEWVTYIHDKGSFHDNGNNRRARKIGTRAALACRKLLLNRDPDSHNWNVCGASFTVLPQFHTSAK